ncbi:mCG1027241, partial [Mus musculus]
HERYLILELNMYNHSLLNHSLGNRYMVHLVSIFQHGNISLSLINKEKIIYHNSPQIH